MKLSVVIAIASLLAFSSCKERATPVTNRTSREILLELSDTVAQGEKIYNSLPAGLSMRDKPDAAAAVIAKIPYGAQLEKFHPSETSAGEESKPVSIGGMDAYWIRATASGKTGYVIEAYVSDYAPPPPGTEDLSGWAKAMSKPHGSSFNSRARIESIHDNGINIHRQLYKNGAVYSEGQGYEYFYASLQLPNTTILKVLNCVRNLKEFEAVFSAAGPLRRGSYVVPAPSVPDGYEWKTVYEGTAASSWLQSVTVSWSDGGYSTLSIRQLETEVIVVYSSGV